MDYVEKVQKWAASLQYPETWITVTGLVTLECTAFLVTTWLFKYLSITLAHQLSLIVFVEASLAALWALGRMVYWRWGGGRKVGISFDLYKIPVDEWVETRKEFSLLCESYSESQKVHLKLLPSRMTKTKEQMAANQKRYGIPFMFHASLSPMISKPGETQLDVRYSVLYGVEVNPDIVNKIHEQARAVMQKPAPVTMKQALQHKAASLFELTLINLALVDFAQHHFEVASDFLKRLDECIAPRFSIDQQPRTTFRWLRCLSLIGRSVFPGDAPPEPDDLLHANALCLKSAEEYGNEFPFVFNCLGRNYFYLRDLDAAIAAIKRTLAPPNLDPITRGTAVLGLAVLSLFQGDYAVAEASFRDFLSSAPLHGYSWADLLKFADYASKDGYPAAIYMKALYRKLAGQSVPKEISNRLASWIGEDPKRNGLGFLYHGNVPSIRTSTGTTNIMHSEPGQKKGKNKNKKRKKR